MPKIVNIIAITSRGVGIVILNMKTETNNATNKEAAKEINDK